MIQLFYLEHGGLQSVINNGLLIQWFSIYDYAKNTNSTWSFYTYPIAYKAPPRAAVGTAMWQATMSYYTEKTRIGLFLKDLAANSNNTQVQGIIIGY